MGNWIVNIIIGVLITLAILILIQLGVNVANEIYL